MPGAKAGVWHRVARVYRVVGIVLLNTIIIFVVIELGATIILTQSSDEEEEAPLVEQVEAKHAALHVTLRAELLAMAEAVDAPHEERLKEVVAQYGWPGRSLVGQDGANAVWLLVQHASDAFQAEVLPLLLEAAEQGEAAWNDAALLQDRVLVFHEGKPQIYGSQLRADPETGTLELAPIQDETSVDERRAEVRLPPLDEYLKGFGLTYER